MDERDDRYGPAGTDLRSAAAYTIAETAAAVGVTVLELRGELDLAAAPALHDRIDEATSARALVLDLTATTFIDSAVLKELLRARAELAAADVRLVLAGVSAPVARLLDLTRTSELFEHAPDAADAVRRLSG